MGKEFPWWVQAQQEEESSQDQEYPPCSYREALSLWMETLYLPMETVLMSLQGLQAEVVTYSLDKKSSQKKVLEWVDNKE
jgi:hypothetical protein